MKKILFLFLSLYCLSLSAECPNGEKELVVRFLSDAWPNESSWNITDSEGTVYFERDFATDTFYNITVQDFLFNQTNYYEILTPGIIDTVLNPLSLFLDTICLPANTCLNFAFFDSFNDGICCGFSAQGSYALILEGDTLFTGGEFFTSETTSFNCPSGFDCTTATEVEADLQYVAPANNAFSRFVPETTGLYDITTCFPDNTCPTGIWIYDDCVGTNILESEGFVDYAANNCDNGQTSLPIGLSAGTEYHIRIGIDNATCGIAPTLWEIIFNGEIEGCTDIFACNYNPLATIDGECIYPGNPDCPAGPDLTIIKSETVNTIHVSTLFVDSTDIYQSCFIQEGCVSGFGLRSVLIFDTRIENEGDLDWFVGQSPASNSGEDGEFWEWSQCHNHYHYKGYAEYLLYDSEGTEIPAGFKAGFCVQDSDCSINGGTAKYNCGFQGLSAGCGDVYEGIDSWSGEPWDCQWLDITDVVDGNYTFVMRVNWNQQPDQLGNVETNYENNWVQICLQLSTSPTGFREVDVLADCGAYVDCAGQIYGDAQPDCAGVCDGTAIYGDYDLDGIRGQNDLDTYVMLSLSDDPISETCSDLNGDSLINVQDAALFNQCYLEESGAVDPDNLCNLPYAVENPFENISLTLGEIDFENNSLQILQIEELTLLGLEFSVEGLTIDSVSAGNLGTVQHNENKVVLLAENAEGFSIDNVESQFFLTLYFAESIDLANNVCINNILGLNQDRESINESFGDCIDLSEYLDCAGLVNGNTEIDCAGECGGTALVGDFLPDNALNDFDVNAYSIQSISQSFSANECNDLNGDGLLNLVDGFLAANCVNNGICDFPQLTGDSPSNATISIESYEPIGDEVIITLKVESPTPTAGLQFKMNSSYEPTNISPLTDFVGSTMNYAYENQILTVNLLRSNLNQNTSELFLSLNVPLDYGDVCLASFEMALDENGDQKTTQLLVDCLPLVGLEQVSQNEDYLTVFPNPFDQFTQFEIKNNDGQAYDLMILDASGNVIRQYTNKTEQLLRVNRGNLPAGLYFYVINHQTFSQKGKLVVF